MVQVRWVDIDAILRWFTQEEWLHRPRARNQSSLNQRDRKEYETSGPKAELSHQTKNIEIDTHLFNATSFDSTDDRTWYLEALTRWLYFSRSGVDGSLHGSALLNLQTDPVILAEAPHFSNLVIGKHTEQTCPHLVESWLALQRPQGRVIEDSRFSMKF